LEYKVEVKAKIEVGNRLACIRSTFKLGFYFSVSLFLEVGWEVGGSGTGSAPLGVHPRGGGASWPPVPAGSAAKQWQRL